MKTFWLDVRKKLVLRIGTNHFALTFSVYFEGNEREFFQYRRGFFDFSNDESHWNSTNRVSPKTLKKISRKKNKKNAKQNTSNLLNFIIKLAQPKINDIVSKWINFKIQWINATPHSITWLFDNSISFFLLPERK